MNLLEKEGVYSLGPYQLLIQGGKYVYLKGTKLLKGMRDFKGLRRPLKYSMLPKEQMSFDKAAFTGHVEILKFLLAKHGKEHFRPKESFHGSPLKAIKYLAGIYGLQELMNEYNFDWHMRERRLDVAQFMISKGANFHKTSLSAMEEASFLGHAESAKFLVDNGADVTQPQRHSCLNRAYEWGCLETAQYLESIGAYYNGPFSSDYDGNQNYLEYINIPIVKHLIGKGYPLKLHPFSNVRINVDKFLIYQLLLYKNTNPKNRKTSWEYGKTKELKGLSPKAKLEVFMELNDKHKNFTSLNYDLLLDNTIECFHWGIGDSAFCGTGVPFPQEKEIFQQLASPKYVDEAEAKRYIKLLFIREAMHKL